MFYIDDFNRNEEMSFEEARRIVVGHRNDADLLGAMKKLEARIEEEQAHADEYDQMDEFYYNWSYEINAFNKVFSDMSKLFAPA